MATYQTAYTAAPAKGLPGQVANEEKCNKISRTVESAAGIAFGQPAFRGVGDHGVVAGAAFAATGAGSARAGNVGTSTITASPAITAGAASGRYTVTQTATGATGPLQVFAPDGLLVGNGVVGTPITTVPGITSFTVTGAGTPTAGDTFYIDVTYTANGTFIGLAVLTEAVPPVATGSTLVDGYPQYYTGGFMTDGQMYVVAGAGGVVDGGLVYWQPATGRYNSVSTGIRILNARFDTTGADGDIVELSMRHR